MLNFRPILLVIGMLLTVLSVAMLIPTVVDLLAHSPDWLSFFISAFLTAFVGISLIFTNQGKSSHLNIRQAFILTAGSWIVLAAFSALPFMFSELNLNYTDAFFESISGLTTTGSTILTGLDYMPPGILIWRALLQWMGGVGIIVLALAVLPMLRIGGMQLFRTESSDKSDKILPRAAQISIAIGSVYFFLTVICAIALWLAGMGEFDAICHAMTSVSTGGFSTHDASIGYYDSQAIETIIVVSMIMSGIPFVLYVQTLRGHTLALWNDSQVRWFLAIIALSVIAVTCWLNFHMGFSWSDAFRRSLFNVSSIISTAGFASHDYSLWGGFAVTLMFLLSVVGGCTGSTTGGIKIFRYQMLYQTAKSQINHLIQPHAVFRPRFNGKPVSESITSSVMSFIILFAFCFLVLAALLSLSGLDYISSMSAAASALANVGPALGPILGPAGTYASIPDVSKWLLSFAMLAGRLEIFTILVLFSPYFWQE